LISHVTELGAQRTINYEFGSLFFSIQRLATALVGKMVRTTSDVDLYNQTVILQRESNALKDLWQVSRAGVHTGSRKPERARVLEGLTGGKTGVDAVRVQFRQIEGSSGSQNRLS